MSTSVDRYKKRKAVSERKAIPNKPLEDATSSVWQEAPVHSFLALSPNERTSVEADTLLAKIHGKLDDEKISALIEACQRECLQAVVRPFGVARILFEDKNGGNVTTLHNFDQGVTATAEDAERHSEWVKSKETPLNREPYDYDIKLNRSGQPAVNKSGEVQKTQFNSTKKKAIFKKMGEGEPVTDGYTGKRIGTKVKNNIDKETQISLEHITSVKEIETESGNHLFAKGNSSEERQQDRVGLARNDSNLTLTQGPLNNSKGDKDLKEWANSTNRKDPSMTNAEFYGANPELVEKEYRKSKDFLKKESRKRQIKKQGSEALATGANEGVKMGMQQAVGVLMEEFARAAFAEIKDSWQNGFNGAVDDTFWDALKGRLMRVVERIQNKWKDALFALRDGFISGFLSNLVTIVINMVKTTSARVVRILREGAMSLYRAFEMLVYHPEEMSLAQAADAASKLLVTGLVTSGGIQLETTLESSLVALGHMAPYVSSIVAGMATGLSTVFIVYLLDQLDIFGVNAESRHEQVIAKLDGMISNSYQQALEAASLFDGPSLKHLT